MNNIQDLQKEITKIKARNRKVEQDKAWEVSWTHRIIITILTYAVIVVFFIFADLPNPYINSIVPTAAYLISSASLPIFKKIWLKGKKSAK